MKANKRILAISDIHGEVNKLIMLLDKVKHNPLKDQLIILGDYCDRGQKSKEVIETCIQLKEHGAVTLKGNHCELFLGWLLTDSFNYKQVFLNNGGLQTIESYLGREWIEQGLTHENYQVAKEYIIKHYKHHIDFLKNNQLYYELNDHVFVHAGIDPSFDSWKDTHSSDYLWIRDDFLNYEHSNKETIVFGHTPTRLINEDASNNIWFGNKKIGIDGGACFKGQLNCLEIKDGKYKQYSV